LAFGFAHLIGGLLTLNNVCPALTPTERGVVTPLMVYARLLGRAGGTVGNTPV
jgi:hypothetical protein